MKTYVLEDDIEYVAVERIIDGGTIYLYLAEINNEENLCVRKEINGDIKTLDDEKEYQKAMMLFAKKNKDYMNYLLES